MSSARSTNPDQFAPTEASLVHPDDGVLRASLWVNSTRVNWRASLLTSATVRRVAAELINLPPMTSYWRGSREPLPPRKTCWSTRASAARRFVRSASHDRGAPRHSTLHRRPPWGESARTQAGRRLRHPRRSRARGNGSGVQGAAQAPQQTGGPEDGAGGRVCISHPGAAIPARGRTGGAGSSSQYRAGL